MKHVMTLSAGAFDDVGSKQASSKPNNEHIAYIGDACKILPFGALGVGWGLFGTIKA